MSIVVVRFWQAWVESVKIRKRWVLSQHFETSMSLLPAFTLCTTTSRSHSTCDLRAMSLCLTIISHKSTWALAHRLARPCRFFLWSLVRKTSASKFASSTFSSREPRLERGFFDVEFLHPVQKLAKLKPGWITWTQSCKSVKLSYLASGHVYKKSVTLKLL